MIVYQKRVYFSKKLIKRFLLTISLIFTVSLTTIVYNRENHQEACSYQEAVTPVSCEHLHNDECLYRPAMPEISGVECSYIHEHDLECGYVEEIVGVNCADEHIHGECGYPESTCNYLHLHDDICGFIENIPEIACKDVHTHDESCGYIAHVPGVAEIPCNHIHDDGCKYQEGSSAVNCDLDCLNTDEETKNSCICDPVVTTEEDHTNMDCEKYIEKPVISCNCENKCLNEQINIECLVCDQVDFDLSNCLGIILSNPPLIETTLTTPTTTPTAAEWFTVSNGVITAFNKSNEANPPTTIVIPSEIGETKITGIGLQAFYGRNYITSVTFPEGIETIGQSAFTECSIAGELVLPSSLKQLGNSAFSKNKITTVKFPDTLSHSNGLTIGEQAFRDNSIETVTIPEYVRQLADYAFYGNKLKVVNLLPRPGNIITGYDMLGSYGNYDLLIFVSKDNFGTLGDAWKNNTNYSQFKDQLTCETTLTFTNNDGTPFAEIPVQQKLMNKSLQYEKNITTNTWEKNVDYKLPPLPNTVSEFGGWNFTNNAPIEKYNFDKVIDDKMYPTVALDRTYFSFGDFHRKELGTEEPTEGTLGVDYYKYIHPGGSNHYFKIEPIIWEVMSVAESKYLMTTTNFVTSMTYWKNDSSLVKYADSEVRRWLNEDFYTSAFSDEEKTFIVDRNPNATLFQDDDPKPVNLMCKDEVNDMAIEGIQMWVTDIKRDTFWHMKNYEYFGPEPWERYWLADPSAYGGRPTAYYAVVEGNNLGSYYQSTNTRLGVRPVIQIEIPDTHDLVGKGTRVDPYIIKIKPTPVENIVMTNSHSVLAGSTLDLTADVSPNDATNKTINWSIKNGGETGITISDNSLSTVKPGKITITATIKDGTAIGTPFTKDFEIIISETNNEGSFQHPEGGAGVKVEKTIYGDTMTFTLIPRKGTTSLFSRFLETGEIAVYKGETRLSEKKSVEWDTPMTFTYDTVKKDISIGDNTLTVKFESDGEITSFSQDFNATLTKKSLTAAKINEGHLSTIKESDGNENFTNVSLKNLTGIEGLDNVFATANLDSSGTSTGKHDVTKVSNINLAGDDKDWYEIVTSGFSVKGKVEIVDAPPTSYTLTVHKGTISGNYISGSTVTISASIPKGKTFLRWEIEQGEVTLLDANSSTTSFVMPAENVTLKVVFDETYKVTFNPTGGSVNIASMLTNNVGKLSSLPVSTKPSFSFAGWFSSSSGGTKITTETKFTSDTTVYAHWNSESSGGGSGGGGSKPVSKPRIYGTTDQTINYGESFDHMTGVSAKDGKGLDITSEIEVFGSVGTMPGEYKINYKVTDRRGLTTSASRIITVLEDPNKDSDNDGLIDKEEIDKGTDPNNIDSDKDGISDYDEVNNGTDPLDPNDPKKEVPEIKPDPVDPVDPIIPVVVNKPAFGSDISECPVHWYLSVPILALGFVIFKKRR